jgi:pyridoxine 5-phosphate synthase
MIRLGLNIDHVATVRNARMALHPDPVAFAKLALHYGADGITAHLREDRRHIRDEDMFRLRRDLDCYLNMEMAATPEMLDIALQVKPDLCTLVPERREELTTEGGLDVLSQEASLKHSVARLQASGILVSLFIDPDIAQLQATQRVGAAFVEFHTGRYAFLFEQQQHHAELERLCSAATQAHEMGIRVNAGHGLTYENVVPILGLPYLEELNTGHFLIGQALYDGIGPVVKKMKALLSP